MLQFARLESLLQQAARSPGRQSWKADGEDQVRAATGELSHCCVHARLMRPFPWCIFCLSAGVLFAFLLVYCLPVGLGSSPIAGLRAHARCLSSHPICCSFTPAVSALNLHLIIWQSPLTIRLKSLVKSPLNKVP